MKKIKCLPFIVERNGRGQSMRSCLQLLCTFQTFVFPERKTKPCDLPKLSWKYTLKSHIFEKKQCRFLHDSASNLEKIWVEIFNVRGRMCFIFY